MPARTTTTIATTSGSLIRDPEHFPLLKLIKHLLNAWRFGQEDFNPFLPQAPKHGPGNRRTGQRIKRHGPVFRQVCFKIDFLELTAFQINKVQVTHIRQSRFGPG